MANVVESFGYSLGKVHTGMLAYLCDLYREGRKAPLVALFQVLSITLPDRLIGVRERTIGHRQRLDFAIIDESSNDVIVAIEVKVDDHETGANPPQTCRYAETLKDTPHCLFVTLGNGEYFREPHAKDKFKWIRLKLFLEAVSAAARAMPDNQLIQDWADALRSESSRREAVSRNDRLIAKTFRAASWNITFLGQLKELLSAQGTVPLVDMTCYTLGSRPDTILNFGWSRFPVYAEINYSGKLSVKVALWPQPNEPAIGQDIRALSEFEKEERFEAAAKKTRNALPDIAGKYEKYYQGCRSLTVFSADIGILVASGLMQHADGPDLTARRVGDTVKRVYSRFALDPLDRAV